MPTAPSRPERVAHRGAPRECTENTLPGFLRALERGADAVELDVHATADGVVIVHHDFDVGGVPIASATWEQLRGSVLPGDARIPTLEEVLAALGTRATVYVELKGRGIEDAVARVLAGAGRRYAVHSFDHEMIARCARRHGDIPRGILLDRGVRDATQAMLAAAPATAPRDVWPHYSLVDSAFMDAARSAGVRVIPWTVNDPALAATLLHLGVAGVCTDDLRLLEAE